MKNNPLAIIIFGATGDLYQKKLAPAFFHLFAAGLLPENFTLTGFGRKQFTVAEYQALTRTALQSKLPNLDASKLEAFLTHVSYLIGNIEEAESYHALKTYLETPHTGQLVCTNRLFYLATPPTLYEKIFRNLAHADLVVDCDREQEVWTRVLVEKPFGSNEGEAMRLDKLLGQLFDESQVFRIDHYLAKEALQNIFTFRFANAIFEPLWNSKHIERIEIKLHEKGDLTGRYNFYDGVGALRDVGQNHMLQMLALVAMEDPKSLRAEAVRTERARVLKRLRLWNRNLTESVFRAQYSQYELENTKPSQTDTFFRLKLRVKNRKWDDVLFDLESGKGLAHDKTEIKVIFRDLESAVCRDAINCTYNNTITFTIQPEHKIKISFWFKKPGLGLEIAEQEFAYTYDMDVPLNDAYEKVLHDCIQGDQTLFPSTQEVMLQWALIADIEKQWAKLPLVKYERGVEPKDIK